MAIEIVDFPIKNGGSFHSYVKLPEATWCFQRETKGCFDPSVSVLLLILLGLIYELLEGLVLRLQLGTFLGRLDGFIEVPQPKQGLGLAVVGLDEAGIQRQALLGIVQRTFDLVQVQPHQ